jgi:transposase
MVRILGDLSADWRRLDAHIEGLTGEIETLARQDQHCERLMTVPGIGPIISSACLVPCHNCIERASSISLATISGARSHSSTGSGLRAMTCKVVRTR